MKGDNQVRGSPHPWGYVHQKVSQCHDIHFFFKTKGITSATEKLPPFSIEPHSNSKLQRSHIEQETSSSSSFPEVKSIYRHNSYIFIHHCKLKLSSRQRINPFLSSKCIILVTYIQRLSVPRSLFK